MSVNKTRQEQAYDFISSTFIKLLENDKQISYEHKRSVIAFWEDLFAHEGVKNNMLQAISNFLWEIDDRNEAARKAGIAQALSTLESACPADQNPGGFAMTLLHVQQQLEGLLRAESTPEEKPLSTDEIESMDLSEVGGNDEDETPLL